MNNQPILWNQSSLTQLITKVLNETKKQGADEAEVNINVSQGFSVTARKCELERVDHNRDKSLDISVIFDKKCGVSSLSDFSSEAIRTAVKAACDIARFTDRDAYAGLADASELAKNWQAPDIYSPWDISVNAAIELALNCEKIAFSKDKRIQNSEGTVVATATGWEAYGNSNGFIGAYPASRHEISCALIASEKDDMQRGYSYTSATHAEYLENIELLAEQAVQRTISRLGPKRLSTQRAPVIFLAEEARGLLGHLVAAISGGNLYRQSSFLLNQLGEKIFPDHITIDERPHLAQHLGSAPFDDDGVATRPNIFIEKGILKSYVLGVYSAKKLGLRSTGNAGGVHNLFIKTSPSTLSDLLKKMHTGFLVTELMGQGVNLVTGDYSRGAAGFWVENGEIQFPVEEATIAGNLREIYANFIEVGSDVDKRGNIKTGSILVGEMMIGGS